MRTEPVYLAGTGTALPGEPVGNATLGKLFGISEEWIELFIGTRSRHFGWDLGTGEVTHTLTDLCAEAAWRALEAAGLDARDLDFVVLATATPDTLLPTTVNQLADRLGLNYLPTYQLQAGCSGAVQALDLARALIAGGHRCGLVLGGDVSHRMLDAHGEPVTLPAEELINYVLFGDGAAAAVICAEPYGESVAVHGVMSRFTGLGRPPGQIVDYHGAARPDPTRTMLFEDYKTVEAQVPLMAEEILWELLAGVGWTPDDVQFILPPQLSGRMTQKITEHLAVPGLREISCVADTGNTGNALPLMQLDKLLPELGAGERALAVVIESSKWIKAGLALERTAETDPVP